MILIIINKVNTNVVLDSANLCAKFYFLLLFT